MSTKFEQMEVKKIKDGVFKIVFKETNEKIETMTYNIDEINERIKSIQNAIDATVDSKNKDIARHDVTIERLTAQKAEIEKVLSELPTEEKL